MLYVHFKMIRHDFSGLARRDAKEFDSIKANTFLNKNKLHFFIIDILRLYNDVIIYNSIRKK